MTARLNFKESPFYTVLEHLTPIMETKGVFFYKLLILTLNLTCVINQASVRESTRDQVDCKIILRADLTDQLVRDTTTRVMIYCASDPLSPFSKADIAFPYQVEIKVNMDEIKANLRGLKNKPGSTRPADITDLLRKRAGYENTVTVTYALTQKRFHLIGNLVRQHSVEELVVKLRSGKNISKEQVVREMISRVQDTDIQATSSIMSLKCPISTLRIEVPCRSTVCSHNQCFDASSFLQLQEQAPTWTCPVCYKIVNFEALTVDQYVNDILQQTPKSIDHVMIEPTGKWFQTSDDNSFLRSNDSRSNTDDEDLIEIKDMPRMMAVKSEANDVLMRTPPTSSREQSTSSAAPPLIGEKRSRGQVIDLTFSSDEDDEPPRAPKRQSTITSAAALPSLPNSETGRPRPHEVSNGPRFAHSTPLGRQSYYAYPS